MTYYTIMEAYGCLSEMLTFSALTFRLADLMARAKRFTYRVRSCMLLASFSWIYYIIQCIRLFGSREAVRYLLNPLWIAILSSLLVKKVNAGFLCTIPFRKVNFIAPDMDALYNIYIHIWIAQDYDRLAKPQGTVIDVGAHIGLFTLRCLKVYNSPLVVAIEPNPKNVQLLRKNLLLNKVSNNVIVVKAAANSKSGKVNLYVADESGRSSLEPGEHFLNIVKVDAVTIDELVHSLNLYSVDYIKVDVEGAELEVINGARGTIRRFKPTLVIETDTHKADKIFRLLEPLNYEFRVAPYGRLIHLVAMPRKK